MSSASAALDRLRLDEWASQRTGIALHDLSAAAIAEYQFRAIQETVLWARRRSAFYASKLAAFPVDWPRSFDEFAQSPLTNPADIANRPHDFLCLPQSEISRIVTLDSSGTSGASKRVFFAAEDQEQTLEFFAYGITSMATAGDRMLIALPGQREGSVGFQLARGIARAGVTAIVHGFISDAAATLHRMDEEKVTLLIGLPVQILAVALQPGEIARRVLRGLRAIVLCSDHIPQSLVQRIREASGCQVFEHYGSTEMGLGGGIECRAHAGYHLREADLHFEIVSPQTGRPLADGETGEIVFTTLGRRGMPLIRYRTGDLARVLPGVCPCGSPLRKLAHVRNRIDSAVAIGPRGSISIADLDDVLFAIPDVLDFTACLTRGNANELEVRIYAPKGLAGLAEKARGTLLHLPAIAAHTADRELQLSIQIQKEPFPATGAKRKIRIETRP